MSHLMYADDLIIYSKANVMEARSVKDCLNLYSDWSGQRINWEKSEIHFSPNVRRPTKLQLIGLLHMKECSHKSKYLGSPFCKLKSRTSDFNFVIEKMVGWKSKFLSMAGRATLIRAVSSTIPSYIMQIFLLPVSVCAKMDKLNNRFLWGVNEERKRFISLRSWDSISVPKTAGGLGLRRAHDSNIAFITKLGWQVCTDTNGTWVKFIRLKYRRGRQITDFETTSKARSWIWTDIQKCQASLQTGLCIRIEENSAAHIQGDPWISELPRFRLPNNLVIPAELCRVEQLMNADKVSWNSSLIQSLFPNDLSASILSTPIFAGEQDQLVWHPTLTGKFSVRFAYRSSNSHRFNLAS